MIIIYHQLYFNQPISTITLSIIPKIICVDYYKISEMIISSDKKSRISIVWSLLNSLWKINYWSNFEILINNNLYFLVSIIYHLHYYSLILNKHKRNKVKNKKQKLSWYL